MCKKQYKAFYQITCMISYTFILCLIGGVTLQERIVKIKAEEVEVSYVLVCCLG